MSKKQPKPKSSTETTAEIGVVLVRISAFLKKCAEKDKVIAASKPKGGG